ncbi:Non-ribosomal peptide synthetase modules and related proteins [gamma proteobacterium HdN1]|nr:Non-ribosomal peptide synthetase modules and related proteins [gamma proteobacterium HdN1]
MPCIHRVPTILAVRSEILQLKTIRFEVEGYWMNIVELLSTLAKKDIRLWLEGENLRFSAPEGVFTGEVKSEVIKRKAEIIDFLKQAKKVADAPIPKADRSKDLALSFGQRRMWVLAQLTPRDVTYNMASALQLHGPIRTDLLQKTFAAIVARHESLRTRFVEKEGDAFQIVDPAGTDAWGWSVTDLAALSEEAQTTALREALDQEVLTPFDLATGPLFRVRVLRQAEQRHVLIVGMHHIVSDGWSMELLVKELVALYISFAANQPDPLPPLTVQYADFAAWQQDWMASDALKKQLSYWHETLSNAPAVLALPTDRPRQANPRNHGAVHQHTLDARLVPDLNRFCQQHELTPFMLFLGAWQLLLGRYAHTRDVIVGSPIAGRSRGEFEDIIGFFVNLLLMRADQSGNPSVDEYFARVRAMALGAFSNQDVPIDHLLSTLEVEAQPGYPPVAQVGFQLINVDSAAAALQGPIRVEPLQLAHVAARMDMLLAVGRSEEGYSLSIEYNVDLFNASTISQIAEQLEFLLTQITSGEYADIESLDLYSRETLKRHIASISQDSVIVRLNGNQRAMLLDEFVHAGTHQNNYGIYCHVPSGLDKARLERAIYRVCNRHAGMRAQIVTSNLVGADEHWLAVEPEVTPTLHLHDFDGGESDASEKPWLPFVEALLHRPQPVLHKPLASFHLVRLTSGEMVFAIQCHHILLDGASTYLLMNAVLGDYRHDSDSAAPEEAFIRYNQQDALHCDRSEVGDFWRRVLAGVEPLDFSKPVHAFKSMPVSQFNDRREELVLSPKLMESVRDWCSENNMTPALFFKGIYALLVREYCRAEEDLAFFEFHANRDAALKSAIGCFYQQSPVIVRKSAWAADASVLEVFSQLQQLRDAARHKRRFSLEAQSVLVPIARARFIFNYYNFVQNTLLDGQTLHPQMSMPKVDKGVQMIVREERGAVTLELRYDVDVFDDLDLLARFESLVRQVVEGRQQVSQLSFVLPEERDWLATQNQTNQTLPPYASVVDWFEHQVATTPDRPAVLHGKRTLSYQQLNQRANQLARYLQTLGTGKGSRVALCLDRGVELITAVWAVLKSGASYVPIDPGYPLDRIDHILKDSGARQLLTVSSLRERLPSSTSTLISLDALSLDAFERENLAEHPCREQEIYVIYTSGSTGVPKGAAVAHVGEINLQHWYLQSLKFAEDDRPVLISAVGFDLTQKNLYAPLLVGGAIVIPEMDFYDDEAILDAIQQHKATWINCAPSAFYPLVEADRSRQFARLSTLRYAVLGGEPIRLQALSEWLFSPASEARLVNSYGPTECTDVVAYHILENVDQATTLFPIGKPVPNMQLHVVNDRLQKLPPGLVGEIAVTGVGVGFGYLNRPELNESVFLKNPFGEGRLYKTGDLGRYLPDGALEYLGRKDFQIKLRGLRIELGEIESALKALANVSDSLVLVRDEQLVGYVLSGGGVTPDTWRESLRARLPEYMVPAALVALERWPLTPNGKIDRKALPEPTGASALSVEKIAPRTATEREIAAVWTEFLGKQEIGVLDNLFELGGNSITATRIASRLRKLFNVQISVREVFRSATVADLAIAVERAKLAVDIPPLQPAPRTAMMPLSFAQQRLWMLDQFDPGLPAYNMPGAFLLRGKLNLEAFSAALRHIVDRHEILRAHIVENDENPSMQFAALGTWNPIYIDLRAWAEDERRAEISRRITNELGHRFDLAKGPLMRVTLIQGSVDEVVMISNMHHIVSDGWSNGVFVHELSQGYDAYRVGAAPSLAPLPVQYADYAVWQRSWLTDQELEKQLAYWRSTLSGGVTLRLPIDFPRSLGKSQQGGSLAFGVPARVYHKLLQISQREGVTLYMILLAAYMVLLARYSNQRDISVGTPIANRNNEAVEGLIGFFVNTLVIRGVMQPSESFLEFLQAIRAQTLGAYAHQDSPFERLVDSLVTQRDLYRTPLFQTMFALQNVPMEQDISLPGISVEPLAVQASQAKFELSLSMLEWQGELRGEFEYRSDLFAPTTIEQLAGEFTEMLQSLCDAPSQSVYSLMSVERASTGWAFIPAGVLAEQDGLDERHAYVLAALENLTQLVADGQPVLLLAEDDSPAARHEVGEIYIPAASAQANTSMKTTTLFDRDWVSTGVQGHCNGELQLILSCVTETAQSIQRGDVLLEGGIDAENSSNEYSTSALHITVRKVWSEVLNQPVIRDHDDFFHLGGHSLLATRVISQLRKKLGLTIPIRTLFEQSRFNDFVAAIEQLQEGMGDARMPPLEPIARDGKLPLSFTQQQLWLLDQLDPGNPAYNMPFALKIEGDLDVTAFNLAFTTIIERHEVLRSNFCEEGGLPYVRIRNAAPWRFTETDLTHESFAENAKKLPALARAACEGRFDIANDLLIRGELVRLGRDSNGTAHFAILGAIHHMVSDGWSLNLITAEIATLYKAYCEKTAALLPPLPIQYVDFAHWQRQWLQGDELDKQVRFWKEKLDNEYQVLDLPTDYPRPPIASSRGESFTVHLPEDVHLTLQQVANTQNATPFMVLLSALYVALHRYSGQEGINVGTPIAGRNLAETEALVGFFINTVIMSVLLDDNPTLEALLARVKTTALDAYAHQALPFEKIVEVLKPKRDPSRAPLFQVFFNLLNLPDPTEVSGIQVDSLALQDNEAHAKYDINIYAKEFSNHTDLMVVFNPDLYRKESVESIIAAMVATLRAFAKPAMRILEIPLQKLSEATVDPTETLEYRSGFNPLARLQQFAEELPQKLAIQDTTGAFTYREFYASVQALAAQLAERGIGEGDVVAVYVSRSRRLPLAIYAILQAGAKFTVLDPAYPVERLQKIVEIAKPALALTMQADAIPAELAKQFEQLRYGALTIPEKAQRLESIPAFPAFDAERDAYIAFTSGTTGEPKGILGCFGPVAHFVEWHAQHGNMGPEERISMLSGLAHDPLLRDIVTPLFVGGTLVIPTQAELLEPARMLAWFQEQAISVTHLTPSLMQLLLQASEEPKLPALRLVAFGGDRLSPEIARQTLAIHPQMRVLNFYGATETPQAMGYIEVTRAMLESASIPVGRGIDGVQLLVVGAGGQLCQMGEVGEIWIRTPYLTKGYLSTDNANDAANASRYIANPFSGVAGDRIYRTGDKARYLLNGSVEFLGRLDQQVKIRGYRVEPGEIQTRLARHPQLSNAAVIAESAGAEPVLVAYVVPANLKQPPEVAALKADLRVHLPEYMVPAAIVIVDSIPLTPNGKLHRAALPDYREALEQRTLVAPRSAMEADILAIWKQVIKSDSIGVTDEFFDVGGHSLLATQVVARVKDTFGIEFSLKNIFEVSTVEGMARYVDTALWARNSSVAAGLEGTQDASDDDMEEIEI